MTYSLSALKWGGIGSTIINQTGVIGGVTWRDFVIDGGNIANIGIELDRMRQSSWSNVKIIRCITNCLKMLPKGLGPTTDDNIQFNQFNNIFLERSLVPLLIMGNTYGNVCHNNFINIVVDYTGTGVDLYNCDNNQFTSLYSYRRSGTGYSLVFNDGSTRNNHINHFQGIALAKAYSTNTIWDYDRENGQAEPIVEANGKLFWTETGNQASRWNMTVPLLGLTQELEGEYSTVGSGALGIVTVEKTNRKMFNRTTYQYLREGFDTVNRKLVSSYYDGNAPSAVNLSSIGSKGYESITLGGCKISYSTAIPTSGVWAVGDRLINTIPTAGGYDGWICVTAGTPGVWKGYGLIQA